MSSDVILGQLRAAIADSFKNSQQSLTFDKAQEIIQQATENGTAVPEQDVVEIVTNPGNFLREQFGLNVSQLRIEPDAYKAIKTFALANGVDKDKNLSTLPLAKATAKVERAMAKTIDFGPIETWSDETSGAHVEYHVKAGGKVYPALHLQKPTWVDPQAPRDLFAATDFAQIATLDVFVKTIRDIMIADIAYLHADDVDMAATKTQKNNERYGIAELRTDNFLNSARLAIAKTQMTPRERNKALGELQKIRLDMIADVTYDMEAGEHTNYWAYWKNFLEPLYKFIAQIDPESTAAALLNNCARAFQSRKTVLNSKRHIDERNIEATTSQVLVYLPRYRGNIGHRVSLKPGCSNLRPEYELLTLTKNADRLPEELKRHAGTRLFRGMDGSLHFDFDEVHLETNGTLLRVDNALVDAVPLSRAQIKSDLALRPMRKGETARVGFSGDWNSDGKINIKLWLISWWGHCHIESPLNVFGMVPRRGVYVLSADQKAKAPVQYFSKDNIWDMAGLAFAASEGGYTSNLGGGYKVQVGKTEFRGERNNGAHWLRLELATGASVMLNAQVATIASEDAGAMYRKNLPNGDGTMSPNPNVAKNLYLPMSLQQADVVAIDVKNKAMELYFEYETIQKNGQPTYRDGDDGYVQLDPDSDADVALSEASLTQDPNGGGSVLVHYYNPKSNMYYSVTYQVKKTEHGFERQESSRTSPVAVARLVSVAETQYDSAAAIHTFLATHPGLPAVLDTSEDEMVWNYPNSVRRWKKLQEVSKIENGEEFTYTTMRLSYETMGGPSKTLEYMLKFNSRGDIVDDMALTPIADFAFRHDDWIAAPVVTANDGETIGYNSTAFDAGYLTHEDGKTINPVLWTHVIAPWHASLMNGDATDAPILRKANGDYARFPNQDKFDSAAEKFANMIQLRKDAAAVAPAAPAVAESSSGAHGRRRRHRRRWF